MAKGILSAAASMPKSIAVFVMQAKDELKKVSWPERSTTINYTLLVIISSLLIGVITGGIDYLLSLLLKIFI